MHGGTIDQRPLVHLGVVGVYWMSWISSFSNTTDPGVTARLRPTSKADSSVVVIRPLAKSSKNRFMPSVTLAPPVSIASAMASGLVTKKLAGLIASTNWRPAKRSWPFSRSSTGAESIAFSMKSA